MIQQMGAACCDAFRLPEPEYVQDNEDYDETYPLNPGPRITTLMFVFIVFMSVFGAGIYSMEGLIRIAYPLLALIGVVLVPMFMGIPSILAASELISSMPDRGGYVVWVDKAFGPFWSF